MKRGGEDGGKADEGREGRRERRDIGTTTHPSPPHTSDDNNSLVPNAHRLWTAFPMHFWCLFFGIRGKRMKEGKRMDDVAIGPKNIE
jgi:hypothetical protein